MAAAFAKMAKVKAFKAVSKSPVEVYMETPANKVHDTVVATSNSQQT